MDHREISRRGALKYLGLLAASAAGREFLSSWLPSPAVPAMGWDDSMAVQHMGHAAEAEHAAPYVPQFFKPDEFKAVEQLAELMIPSDDKPGAREAKVANYIDFVIFSAREFEPSLQREWRDGLAFLNAESQKQFGKAFRLASIKERVSLLTDMSLPERDPGAHHPGYGFFKLVKNLTVEGFYTSQIGLIDVLDFQGMNYNGDFPGCTHPEHQE